MANKESWKCRGRKLSSRLIGSSLTASLWAAVRPAHFISWSACSFRGKIPNALSHHWFNMWAGMKLWRLETIFNRTDWFYFIFILFVFSNSHTRCWYVAWSTGYGSHVDMLQNPTPCNCLCEFVISGRRGRFLRWGVWYLFCFRPVSYEG